MFQRVVGIRVKVGQGELHTAEGGKPEMDFHLSVAIPFEGGTQARYVLSVSSDVAVNIASCILKEDATRESEEVVEDSVKEFCNIVCGNAAAKLAQMGIQVDIAPPESLAAVPSAPEGGQAVVFPVHLAEGGLDLRFLVPGA
jgi:CheY-specific phosphatase CheX